MEAMKRFRYGRETEGETREMDTLSLMDIKTLQMQQQREEETRERLLKYFLYSRSVLASLQKQISRVFKIKKGKHT